MTNILNLPDSEAYNTPVKTIPGYNGKRGTKHSPLSSLANASVIRAAFPRWSRMDHAVRAAELRTLENDAKIAHSALWESAFAEKYGRKPDFWEFRISGIGNDGLAEAHKDELRRLAVLSSQASMLTYLHEKAAGIMALRKLAS